MADEISVTHKIVYAGKETSGGAKGFTLPETTDIIDQTGIDFTRSTQSIGTAAAEALVVSGEIATQGLWYVRNANLNTGNLYIGLSGQTLGSMAIKLNPGDPPAIFRASAPIFAMASNLAVVAEYMCLEE